MKEYIERQSAIEELAHFIKIQSDTEIVEGYTAEQAAKDFFRYIPSADVRENVKGRWVEVVDRTEMYDKEGVKTWGMLFQCNQCGFVLNAIEGHTGQYNYCPNCGADMRQITALSKKCRN